MPTGGYIFSIEGPKSGGGTGTVTSVTNADGTIVITGTPTIAPVVSRAAITGDVSIPSASDVATLQSTANVQAIIRSVAGTTNIPAVGRLFVGGHSFSPEPFLYASNAFNTPAYLSSYQLGFPSLLRSVFSLPTEVYQTFIAPQAAAATNGAILVPLEYPSAIHSWTYIPLSAIAANGTNFRTYTMGQNAVTYATINTSATTIGNGTGTTPQEVGIAQFNNASLAIFPGNEAFFLTPGMGGNEPGQHIYLNTTVTGTGVADPGGIMTVRLIGRYANVSLGGANLVTSDVSGNRLLGGWSTWAKLQPLPATYPAIGNGSTPFIIAGQVRYTGGSTIGVGSGVTVTVDQIPNIASLFSIQLPIGTVVRFSGGGLLTLTSAANYTNAASSLVGNLTLASIQPNELGVIGSTSTTSTPIQYQSNAAKNGLVITCWGINDVGSVGGVSESASGWKEAVRYTAAIACCSTYRQYGFRNSTLGNGLAQDDSITFSAGTGTWTTDAPANAWTARPTYNYFNGTPNASSFFDIMIPAWYDGTQPVNLFFASTLQGQTSVITAASLPSNGSTTVNCTAAGTWTVGQKVVISGAAGAPSWTNLNGTWTVTVGGSGTFSVVVTTTPNGAGTGGYTANSATATFASTAWGGNGLITYGSAANGLTPTALFSGANAGSNIKVNNGNTAGVNDVIDTGSVNGLTVAAGLNGSSIAAANITLTVVGTVPTTIPTAGIVWVYVTAITTPANTPQWVAFSYTSVTTGAGGSFNNCNIVDTTLAGTFTTGNFVDNAPSHQFNAPSNASGQGVGMVRRISNLPAGGGRIRVSIQAMAGNVGGLVSRFLFDLWGIEASGPTQPVVICSIPYVASPATAYPVQPTTGRIDQFNTATTAVVTEFTGGNVVVANLNSFMGVIGTTVNPTFYGPDGVHPNDKGHVAIASAIVAQVIGNFTNAQLMTK